VFFTTIKANEEDAVISTQMPSNLCYAHKNAIRITSLQEALNRLERAHKGALSGKHVLFAFEYSLGYGKQMLAAAVAAVVLSPRTLIDAKTLVDLQKKQDGFLLCEDGAVKEYKEAQKTRDMISGWRFHCPFLSSSPPSMVQQHLAQFVLYAKVKCGNEACKREEEVSETTWQFKMCSNCGLPRYCSAECAKVAWSQHKPFCHMVCPAPADKSCKCSGCLLRAQHEKKT